jgi:hypothetical protein
MVHYVFTFAMNGCICRRHNSWGGQTNPYIGSLWAACNPIFKEPVYGLFCPNDDSVATPSHAIIIVGAMRERGVFIPPLGMVHSWHWSVCVLWVHWLLLQSTLTRKGWLPLLTHWCSYKVNSGCYLVDFSCFSSSYKLDLHNKIRVASPNVWWKHMQKSDWKSDLPWCRYGYRKCLFVDFMFSNSYILDLHNKTCVALANLWWKYMQKTDWKSYLPWCSYGYRKCLFVDFLKWMHRSFQLCSLLSVE